MSLSNSARDGVIDIELAKSSILNENRVVLEISILMLSAIIVVRRDIRTSSIL